jgi:hypothetical protein
MTPNVARERKGVARTRRYDSAVERATHGQDGEVEKAACGHDGES